MLKLKDFFKKVRMLFSRKGLGYLKVYLYKKTKYASVKDIFTAIYEHSLWGDGESISGAGSDLRGTEKIRKEIPKLIRSKNIKTILDIPCGDFFWMKEMELDVEKYIGADIVTELVEGNKKYENEKISFVELDLLRDKLPEMDMILCHDCLFHFSYQDVAKALQNIKRSNVKYLLVTTFIGPKENTDIPTGSWRPLNLELAPFNFPKPIFSIEDYEKKDAYPHKRLAFWEINSLPMDTESEK
jgi:hypothetical protein